MERLTERHEYNGKNHISVDREKNGITCSNFCTNCGRADCDDIRNALYKLAEYEDLEEQGLLLRLPCKVGDTVWMLHQTIKDKFEHSYSITKMTVVEQRSNKLNPVWFVIDGYYGRTSFSPSSIGKTIFLTNSEAEEALRKMKESTDSY